MRLRFWEKPIVRHTYDPRCSLAVNRAIAAILLLDEAYPHYKPDRVHDVGKMVADVLDAFPETFSEETRTKVGDAFYQIALGFQRLEGLK